MERKIGEIFIHKGKTYKILKAIDGCKGCTFYGQACADITENEHCSSSNRKDKTSIIFKEINNMEIKNNQLTIDIPKGMEIDTENSDFTKGIIKFKPKYITYDDIVNSANSIDSINALVQSSDMIKLEAIEQLISIARYYNKDWRPNWDNSKEKKYLIKFDSYAGEFFVDYDLTINLGGIYFKNKEDAYSVIDNPNFREILDTIYKKQIIWN